MVLGGAALILLLVWPFESELDPTELSRVDGKPRFRATTYSQVRVPANLSLGQQVFWKWNRWLSRRKPNPAGYKFPARPVELYSLDAMLKQCMEVNGTRYLIAVEIGGAAVEFGSTRALNGTEWVAAFERAIETSKPLLCYDFAEKRNFQDTVLLIRERPGLVKVVPRSKLTAYQKAGLVKRAPP